MRTIKAVFIDAENRKVENVVIEASLQSYYKKIGCDLITSAGTLNKKGDWLIVDDEGLLKHNYLFKIKYQGKYIYPDYLAGNGLILGSDKGGNTKSVTIDAKDVEVEFFGKFGGL